MVETKTNTFFKGLSVQTIVTFVMGGIEMVLFALFSRLLTKTDFGYFAAMAGIIVIFQSISEAGLGSSIIQKKNATERFVSTAFSLSISMGALFSVLVFFLSPLLAKMVADDNLTTPLRIMSVSFLLHSLISVGYARLYRQLKFKRVGIIRCTSFFISGIVGIILAINNFGLYSIVAYVLLDSIIIVLIIYTTSVKLPKLSFSKSDSKEIIHFGGWLTLGVILNNLTRQLDKIITSRLISVEALGAYNRPAGFVSNLTSRITGIFDNVLFPMLSDLQDQKERVLGIFYRSISLLNSISAVLSVVFFFNAELIITLFFGENWLDITPIMRIVSISVLFNVDGQLVDCFFRSLNYVKTGFFLRLMAAIITLISIVYGSRYGIMGLAVGLVISNVTMIIVKVLTLTMKMEANLRIVLKAWLSAWKPAVPLVLFGLFFYLLPFSVIMGLLQAFAFGIVILLEFVFYPQLVGKEYVNTIYPKIAQLKTKLVMIKK